MRICVVAAPLIARSGVYHSLSELVVAARSAGLAWSAEVGVATSAPGTPAVEAVSGIREFACEPSGLGGVVALSRRYRQSDLVRGADLIISMNPQSDMALALTDIPWAAYLRGLPWPAHGEASRLKRLSWTSLERAALHRAREVWATTEVLVRESGIEVDRLVPPGLDFTPRPTIQPPGETFVWAARYSADKGPDLLLDALRGAPFTATMFGSGPLADQLVEQAPPNVRVAGWAGREELWANARAYVGTSTREAFGRSAVEAALRGIPSVLADSFGAAPLLYRDAELRRLLVLPRHDVPLWRSTLDRLARDDELHRDAAQHVKESAERLTITAAVSAVETAAKGAAARTSTTRRSSGRTP